MTPLIRLSLAWIGGIALARWLNAPWEMIALLAVCAVAGLLLYRRDRRFRFGAILALAAAAGAARFLVSQPTIDKNHIAFYNDMPEPVTITGVVDDEPDIRDTYVNLRLRPDSITLTDNHAIDPIDGLVLVRAPRYPEYSYGDRLKISGRLETPPIFDTFSYKDYLARFGIYAMMRRVQIERAAKNQGNPLWAMMLAFKHRASQTLNHILPEPHASLLNGIFLGIETAIPDELYELFNLTGTSHIIVISGSNIAVVAGILLLLGQRIVGKRLAPPLAIGGIIIYTLLVGADGAVSRAAVMGIVWVTAIWVGRPAYALHGLFASAIFLTLINPLILWDVGFQLSFMATLGLILLVPLLERTTFGFLQRRLRADQIGLPMALLSELLIITLAAQIATGPLIVYHFGRFSLVSLLSNLLILPVQPPIMTLGGLAALAGMVWLPLGQLLGWIVWLPLAWTVWIVKLTSNWPYASLELGQFPFWLLILIYALLGSGIWWANRPRAEAQPAPRFRLPPIGSPATRVWLGGMGVITLLVWLAVGTLPDGRLHVAFLDVGQGDAILITLPDGRQMLIDGGPAASELNWRLGQEMPFWDRSLDVVINTHPDLDHLGGLVSLSQRYEVGQTIVSDFAGHSALYHQWEQTLAGAPQTTTIGQAGMRLTLGPEITATLLSPGPHTPHAGEANNHSVVLHLQMDQISFLFPGDIEAPIEQDLVQRGAPLAATVLKSPHHGSATSSTGMFLDVVNPQIVVISVGQDNAFGHPSQAVLERYTERGLTVLRTDQQGTIELVTDGEKLWVETAP